MSKNGNGKKSTDVDGGEKKVENPHQAISRLTKEIIAESKLIATGVSESCYNLVEKTKQLISAEEKL